MTSLNEPATFLGVLNTLIAAAAAIAGVGIGGWFSSRNSKRERRQRVVQQKPQEFCGPLLAIRNRIKAKSELRLKISQFAGEQWPKRVHGVEPESLPQNQRERWPKFERIEYEKKRLRDETLPSFEEMITIFTSRIHLADASTRAYLAELIDFPEVWDRWLDESLPKEILARLDHSERRLFPFYEDLGKARSKIAGRNHRSIFGLLTACPHSPSRSPA